MHLALIPLRFIKAGDFDDIFTPGYWQMEIEENFVLTIPISAIIYHK